MGLPDFCDLGHPFAKTAPSACPLPYTMEIQCLGEGQLQVSVHKGTATTSNIGEVSSKLEQ